MIPSGAVECTCLLCGAVTVGPEGAVEHAEGHGVTFERWPDGGLVYEEADE